MTARGRRSGGAGTCNGQERQPGRIFRATCGTFSTPERASRHNIQWIEQSNLHGADRSEIWQAAASRRQRGQKEEPRQQAVRKSRPLYFGTMRRRLTTPDPSDFSQHDHVVWCGDGPEALYSAAVAAFVRRRRSPVGAGPSSATCRAAQSEFVSPATSRILATAGRTSGGIGTKPLSTGRWAISRFGLHASMTPVLPRPK